MRACFLRAAAASLLIFSVSSFPPNLRLVRHRSKLGTLGPEDGTIEVKGSGIKFMDAFKMMSRGSMRKRDFFKSRMRRVAQKINPYSDCHTDQECLVETREANPTDVVLALKAEFGENWWQRPGVSAKFFGK